MPKAKKKDKPPPVVVGEEGMTQEEIFLKTQMQIESMERQFVQRTEEMTQARTEEGELREKCEQLETDYENTQKERFDIISDFTRQHKAMQDELITRITVLENTICDLKDQLELSRIALEETRKDKDQIIAQKDKEIIEQEQKMVEMADEFEEMLKDTLQKMSERIENTVQTAITEPPGKSTPGDAPAPAVA
uniref:Dynein regulatory complex protein 12 n=1 Tax=Eutreptiella gymnastica TaxID=73025 RepID=A0A7S1HXZ2_9EUGL|mmetsp:Transcript_113455/g.197030  ORF Transcript_113455/g.197030 Transcript_113455/m.197030 type:complete len:192 (+) Transcript_113455:111-686(+)